MNVAMAKNASKANPSDITKKTLAHPFPVNAARTLTNQSNTPKKLTAIQSGGNRVSARSVSI